jgi:asparagine synthase (glutamine-hydrolysing)
MLARDFLGKKPLYYHQSKNTLFFSSQLDLVKKFVGQSEINYEAISSYFQLGYILDPTTIYVEVQSLRPGETLVIDSSTLEVIRKTTFTPKCFNRSTDDNDILSIQDAVKIRTDGHNKFALSLSGGIDSTVIAIESKKMNLPIHTYSLKWSDSDKDKYNRDSEKAKRTADVLKLPFTQVDMPHSKEIPNILETFVLAMGEPNSNPTGLSMIPLYSKIHEDGHKLVLTGDGADEIFGGYPRYEMASKINLLPQVNSKLLRGIIMNLNPNFKLFNKISVSLVEAESDEFWLFWHLIMGKFNLNKLFPNQNYSKVSPSSLEFFKQANTGRVSSLMIRDLCTWLVMESNRKLDRISMWHSIEARSPFQSESLINAAYNQMSKLKFKKIDKQVLKEMYPELGSLPIHPKKHGFISPLGHWLRANPKLIKESINSLPEFIKINEPELNRLSSSVERKNFHEMKILWSIVVLNQWLTKNF